MPVAVRDRAEAAVSAALTNKNSSSPSATAEGVQEKAGYITPDKIREMCYAPDLNMVIFITDVYSYKVSLYRYDIRANSLEEAMNLNEEEIFGFFSEFGPRVGNVIKLTASYGDAGHTFEEFVEYDYEANTYITKSTCHTWYEYEVDGSDGEEMKECKEL